MRACLNVKGVEVKYCPCGSFDEIMSISRDFTLWNVYTGSCCFSALRIHASEACKTVLCKLGGYELEQRGSIAVKVWSNASYSF